MIKTIILTLVSLHIIKYTKAQIVSVTPAKVDFGSPFTVEFENRSPFASNWIGIYAAGYSSLEDEELWAGMCGDQDTWNTDACPPQSTGTISFKFTDPDQESDSQFPINPGFYEACLSYEDSFGNYVKVTCTAFKVKSLPGTAITDSRLYLTTSSFLAVGDPITANFVADLEIPNTWIGIYDNQVQPSLSELPGEPYLWVYSACNNQAGDQVETNNCAATKSSGSIQIDSTSQDRSMESWPLGEGEYKLCMSFFNNSPYSKFVCSKKFLVGDPPIATLTMAKFKNN